jgi:carbon-monoxide dehydrogenase iron sulfur subunit
MAKVIHIHIDRCMACKSCEMACAVAHSTSKELYAAILGGDKPGHRISVEAYGRKAVPVNCNHCEEAACVMACPTGAVHREKPGDPVIVDNERCIGCRMCVMACPFGVITVSPDGKGVLKCDLCIERLADGKEPACVEACPTSALVFVDEGEANAAKRRKTAERMVAAQQAD